MLELLFQMVICPIQLIIHIAFIQIANIFRANGGIAIIGVSFIVSLLCLPMYDKAHTLQEEEKAIREKMEPKLQSIKRNFKGDEKYMLISTYYRENHYSPFMTLRNSLSLLIQIPFFIAAYLFFSHLPFLDAQEFLFIKDLSLPDRLLNIGSYTINIMPVIMTAINIIAGEIYTKGHNSLRERVQIYGIGLIFLFLLYNSPSGLVLYWTCNNIFSLVKNISYRVRNSIYILYGSLWCILLFTIIFYITHKKLFYYNYCTFGIFTIILAILPFFISKFGNKICTFLDNLITNKKTGDILLLSLGFGNCLLLGACIPFNVVASSPFEFSFIGNYSNPIHLLTVVFFQAVGIFVFWPFCLSKMFSKKITNILVLILGSIFFMGLLNIFVLTIKYGSLTSTLQLENIALIANYNPSKETLFAVFDLLIILFFVVFIIYKKTQFIKNTTLIIIISLSCMILHNGVKIEKGFLDYKNIKKETLSNSKDLSSFINMSKNKKNVVVFMLDRAISSFLPIIFEKKAELKKSFDGFTYYPNTVSYSSHTITAAPALYGGYEYTPEEQNLKSNTLMKDKHNEAILMLPKLFLKNNWTVTMSDAPLYDYKWVANPKNFKKLGINYDNLIGKYTDRYKFEHSYTADINDYIILKHNFLFYSFLNAAPINQKINIYQGGKYWNAYLYDQNIKTSTKVGLENYSALYYLPKITKVNSDKNSFFFLQNELPHCDFNLEYPDFTPKVKVNNIGEDFFHDAETYERYQVNMASIILMSRWLDKLRELGVYDNTRIIIVSDHGIDVKIPTMDKFSNTHITPHNPILLVKDFNSHGKIKINNKFMTNADVPFLATENVVKQINPTTGKQLTTKPKEKGVNILLDFKRIPEEFKGANAIDEKSKMWHIKDNIYDKNNWSDITPSEIQLEKSREGKKYAGTHSRSRHGEKTQKFNR